MVAYLPAFLLLASASIHVTAVDHPLGGGARDLPLVEPHVAVSPVDRDHLVVGTIVASADREGPWRCAAFLSRDRGASWIRHDFDIDRCIDPWVVIGPDGSALLAAIEIRRDVEGDERFRLVTYRSEDGGRRWPATPTFAASAYEHPIVVASGDDFYLAARRMRRAPDGSPRHAVGIERSADGGRRFDPLAEIRPGDLASNPTGISVRGDRVVVTFIDFQRNVDGFDRAGMLAHPRAWALVSSDGGETFSEPKFVSESCGMRDGFPGYPYSTSDPESGRVYFACVRPRFEGLALHVSPNGGDTWSDPIRLDDGSPHVRTPMLAVNRDGVLGAAWYDRRHDEARRCQHLYFAASADGGASFIDPLRVSTESSCPGSGGNGRAAESWSMGGDYTSLAAGPDGSFHVVWADSRSGRFRLRTATLEVRSQEDE